MEKDLEVMLSMDKKYLEEKKLDYRGYAATKFVGQLDKDTDSRIFTKNEFLTFLKTRLELSRYKANTCIEMLETLGLAEKIDEDTYRMAKIDPPFLKLYGDTVRYFFDHYSPEHFKVYCYLLNKYNIHKAHGYMENYFFSCAELLRIIGYNSKKFQNIKYMNEILIDLENNHFIKYNHETVGRPGKHGRYKELYWVNPIAENSKVAFGETILQDKIGPNWFNGDSWYSYTVIDFTNQDIMRFLLQHKENMPVVKYALEQGDILPQYEKACMDFVGRNGKKSR